MSSHSHFEGKDVIKHLKEARLKGSQATAESHGTETPGHITAGIDSAKEIVVFLYAFWMILTHFQLPTKITLTILFAISITYFLWKVGRSTLLGWARLERLHRLIEEERWEIEHHRAQEKEELTAMYAEKGLSGKLLEEVIEVLMADDQRLLQLMLTEELGLTVESYEHPLKQGLGSGIGVIIASCFGLFGLYYGSFLGGGIVTAAILFTAAWLSAKFDRNRLVHATLWNFSVGFLSLGILYFIIQLL